MKDKRANKLSLNWQSFRINFDNNECDDNELIRKKNLLHLVIIKNNILYKLHGAIYTTLVCYKTVTCVYYTIQLLIPSWYYVYIF